MKAQRIIVSGLLSSLVMCSGAANGATITSIVGTESLVTDTAGNNATNIAAANGATLTSLIVSDGGAGDGPNGTGGATDVYDAARFVVTNGGGSEGSFTSGGVTVDYADAGLDFTFTYSLPGGTTAGDILSAVFHFDISDDDDGSLTFTTDNGQNIGSTSTLGNYGTKPSQYWAAVGDGTAGNIDSSLAVTLDANERADLLDGSYKLSGAWANANSSAFYGSNRAKLVIDVVPEPSTFVLAAIGIAGLALLARRRK